MFSCEKFILINLNSEKKRLISTLDELYKINKSDSVIRIEACDKKKAEAISYRYISQKAEENIKNPISTGILPNYSAVGCAISHIRCWKYIIDNNIQGAFILEDDIKINDMKKFKNDLWTMNRVIEKNKHKQLFLVFNALSLNNSINNSNYNYYNDFRSNNKHLGGINDMFCGTHFYYINIGMAKILFDNIYNIDYQIDMEIGRLSSKYYTNNKVLFLNYNTCALGINNKFKTSIQFYVISLNEIMEIFNISEDIAEYIYKYIPQCFKKSRDKIYNQYTV